MLLLSATDLYKTYGLKTIFDHISLNIDSRIKIGLLGVNGTGKSTLLRILAGLAQADSGEIQTSNQLVMEYLPQHPDFDENATVLQQIFRGESAFMKVLRSYEQTLDALEHDPGNQALTQQLLELSAQMDEQKRLAIRKRSQSHLKQTGHSRLFRQSWRIIRRTTQTNRPGRCIDPSLQSADSGRTHQPSGQRSH